VKLSNKLISELNFDIIPNEKTIVVESVHGEDEVVLHACLGTKINSTIAILLSSLLSSTLACEVDARSDAYRICLSSKKRISEKYLIDELTGKFDIYNIMTTALKNTNDMNWKTWCVAKQFSVVERGATFTAKAANFIYRKFEDGPIVKEALRELFHNKFDLPNTQSILTKIKNKEIIVTWIENNKFSSLADPILDNTAKTHPNPNNLDKSILDLVRKRLAKTQHRLVCARCGKWQKLTTPEEMPNTLRCKYCKGTQIAATYFSDLDLQKIIQKNDQGKKLSQDESYKFEKAWKVSNLLIADGKNALIVLSGYGVGPETAGRILKNGVIDDDDLIKRIMTAEKQYALTRGFWDD
jgi:ATP-dependent Lhr-like helicase